ncbi:GIY-YIG nuclease family protein [Shewanella eurypsychrophilus]|uniref:GIY-YIG nuclease family protein n=1 Tax=Shewanella eurypsychrophilus TaxID=2593656 RepID=A0ABX6V5Q6_9GAMM|nr:MULTISPECIES: GIY-YIG nuclease family protein [Shewanella]QFU22385.1 GIY-YIG nuclease family protein [Shewanella sp. YLB-09]QPG57672.1 GIY-YIG nuclease family protein [Shewanella eurypsychrophilus]
MAAQTYSLEFEGYWREPKKGSVPAASGIYNVYTCLFNESKKTVTLKKHLYTGESQNVRERLSDHEKQPEWEKHLKTGEVLCFSVAKVSSTYRVRCEAAIINQHKPPVNTEYVNNFPFDETTMNLSGKIKFLQENFTVYRKD